MPMFTVFTEGTHLWSVSDILSSSLRSLIMRFQALKLPTPPRKIKTGPCLLCPLLRVQFQGPGVSATLLVPSLAYISFPGRQSSAGFASPSDRLTLDGSIFCSLFLSISLQFLKM